MASKSGIRAAKAFVEFSADLSGLPGDFQDAESQFKAFKDRVNKRDSLSSVRADLDTKAAEGKLDSLQSRVRDALDPKGAPLLANVGRDLDARINTLLPRLRKLFEQPLAKKSDIQRRVAEQLDAEKNAYAEGSIRLAERRIRLEGQLARRVAAASATNGRSAKVAVTEAAIKATDDARAALEKRFSDNSAAIVESGYKEAEAYQLRQSLIRGRLQDEIEGLTNQRKLIEGEQKKLDKARDRDRPPTGIDQAISKQEQDSKDFSAGLQRRLKEEADYTNGIAKLRQKQIDGQQNGLDQTIAAREQEGRAFSSVLQQRLQEENNYANEIAKLRQKQIDKTPTGIDQEIVNREQAGKDFSAGLQQRLNEEAGYTQEIEKLRQKQIDSQQNGFDQTISAREQEGRDFSASLQRRLKEEADAVEQQKRLIKEQQDARRRQAQNLAVFGQDLRQIGAGLFTAGAAGLAGFGVAVKNFAELDRTLRAIQGIAAATDAEMSGLETTVRKLGATTSFTTQEVATAAQELARGGQSLANIQNTLPAVLNLARGTGSDLAFSAQSVVRTLGQFQLATTESTRVVDSLAAAANAGTLDLQDLGESMKFLGPIAETTGESVESVGAAFAVMANNGLRGGLAGRQLRRVFYELADPLKRLKILSELGVDTFDPAGNLRPIADLVSEIGAALNQLPSGKKINFLDDIFGEGAAAFEALSKGRKEFRALIADIEVADGYAAKLAQGIDKGLYGQFLILISAISELGNTISEGLEPLLLPLLKYIQKVAQSAIEWASANKGTIATLATMSALAAGLGLALIGIGSSVAVIGAVASAVQVLSVALNAANISALALARGTFVGLAASIAVLAIAGEGMATYFDGWIDQIEEASLYADDASQKVGQLAQALTDLNSVSMFDNTEDIEKFKNLVAGLEAQVGSLGAKFDKITGKPINSDAVEQRAETAALIENNKRLEGEALKRLRDKEAELQAYEASFSGLYADAADPLGKGAKFEELSGEVDEARSKMNYFAKEQQRLREDLKAEQAGIDLAAALGVKFDPKDPVGTLLGPTSGAAFSSISAGVGKVFSFQLDKFGDDVIGPLAGLAEKYARQDLASGNANPLSAAVANIADVLDSSTTSGLSQSLGNSVKLFGETVGGTLGAAARFLAENLRVSEAEKAKEFEEALQQRASDLVSKFDLGGTSRQGAFGIEEAQRQVAGQTTNLLAQALREEQQTNKLLEDVKTILKSRPGLIGK